MRGAIRRGVKFFGKWFGLPRLSKKEFQFLSGKDLKHPEGRVVYFEFGKNDLRRTLYTFFKFFDLAQYNCVVNHDNHLFAEMKGDHYGRWVIEEELIRIGSPQA
ncbi:MAG: hypothetical protein RJQ14_11750, partial [Marinoscillum sp.]